MSVRGAAREALRDGTRAAHEALDGLFARFDLADERGYRRFLKAHAMALPPLERALDEAGMARLLDDWPARRRADALAADLAALGEAMPSPLAVAPLATPAAAWGTVYVLEGSRLGGAMLARAIGIGLPHGYLGAPQPPGSWRKLLERLELALYQPDHIGEATEAAAHAFVTFGEAGRTMMERHER